MNLNKSGVDEPDRELFVRLIMRHDRAIRAFLRGLLPTAADVDEVMQEVSVRVTRFSDGSTVDVHARHRVIAAADREMLPEPVPNSVIRWKSQLQIGLDAGRGKWSPGTESQDARLATIPYTSPLGQLIYTVSFDVSRGHRPPVILQPASGLRVRGRLASPHSVYFGVTVRHASGKFAGRFQTIRPADEFPGGQGFDMTLHLRDFRLDPSLDEMKNKLPSVPFGLVVESVWCHTLDKQAGLEISEVELAPAMLGKMGDAEQFNIRSKGGMGQLESFHFVPDDMNLTDEQLPKVKFRDPEIGVWHTIKLTVVGKNVTAELDGEVILDHFEYPEGMLKAGPNPIRFQKHRFTEGAKPGERNPCPIEYRNVFIKELGPDNTVSTPSPFQREAWDEGQTNSPRMKSRNAELLARIDAGELPDGPTLHLVPFGIADGPFGGNR